MIHREISACGVTCFTPHAWRETSMGESFARHPLMNYENQTYLPETLPVPFSTTNDKRALAETKIVQLVQSHCRPARIGSLWSGRGLRHVAAST